MACLYTLVFILIFGCIGVIAGIELFYYPISYWCSKESSAEISFGKFITFYKSAPRKWDLRDDYVRYNTENGKFFIAYEDVYFQSYFDYRRYKKWLRKILKDKKEHEKSERLLELTKCWSKDVNNHYQSSMDEISAMYQDNLDLSKRYEENLKRIKQKYKIRDEDIVSYSVEPIDGARIIKTKGGSSVRIPMYELLT